MAVTPKRNVIVEFVTLDGQVVNLNGLDVKFTVDKNMTATMNKAEISIGNMTNERVAYLTTWCSPWVARINRKRVSLFAGYDDDIGLLFDGDVVRAIPTVPPDIYLECQALEGYYVNREPISISFTEPTPFVDIWKYCANELGLKIDWKAREENIYKVIPSFYVDGCKLDLIKEINRIGGVIAYQDGTSLKIVDYDIQGVNFKETPGIAYYDRNRETTQEEIPIISPSTGMIGIPQIDERGAIITMLLNNKIEVASAIQLSSNAIPSANGVYFVYKIRHSGHLRGNKFYTTLYTNRTRILSRPKN